MKDEQRNSFKNQLKEKLTSGQERIEVSDEALGQLKLILDVMTERQLDGNVNMDIVSSVVDMYSADTITGEIRDDVLYGMPEDQFQELILRSREDEAFRMEPTILYVMRLVYEVFEELRYFTK